MYVARWELDGVSGAVVVVDVIRAFTTAAYAFGAGAREIVLVDTVEAALAYKATHPGALAMGEDRGRRPDGFDFSNSPVALANADLEGREIVQRTSAGTQGVVAARHADRLWCASLVCASATAAAIDAADLGAPTYVITGRFADDPDASGDDDLLTARHIEAVRTGQAHDAASTVEAIRHSREAWRTLALGSDDAHPQDVEFALRIDLFRFAMEVTRAEGRLRMRPVSVC